MFHWLFKPRPYPAFVLLAIILIIFGVQLVRLVPILGEILFIGALVLLISFIRGVKQDLEVMKIGVIATANITGVEVQSGTYRKRRYRVWQVHFTFHDLHGNSHEDIMPLIPIMRHGSITPEARRNCAITHRIRRTSVGWADALRVRNRAYRLARSGPA